ncbi:MAG: hypothetical protein WBV39_09865 [Rudaea sp.]
MTLHEAPVRTLDTIADAASCFDFTICSFGKTTGNAKTGVRAHVNNGHAMKIRLWPLLLAQFSAVPGQNGLNRSGLPPR